MSRKQPNPDPPTKEYKMKKHIEKLGLKAIDKVTGFNGVITSVSFDLYGCIQYVITPPMKDGKIEHGAWYDSNRIQLDLEEQRVMPLPNYNSQSIANGDKGCAIKSLP